MKYRSECKTEQMIYYTWNWKLFVCCFSKRKWILKESIINMLDGLVYIYSVKLYRYMRLEYYRTVSCKTVISQRFSQFRKWIQIIKYINKLKMGGVQGVRAHMEARSVLIVQMYGCADVFICQVVDFQFQIQCKILRWVAIL